MTFIPEPVFRRNLYSRHGSDKLIGERARDIFRPLEPGEIALLFGTLFILYAL